jgi:hypothetical protein
LFRRSPTRSGPGRADGFVRAPSSKGVSTVHLGQFTRETANEIAGELEKAGIVWWYKEPGWISAVWEFGVRLFVDRTRLNEANDIAERITAARQAKLDKGQDEPQP